MAFIPQNGWCLIPPAWGECHVHSLPFSGQVCQSHRLHLALLVPVHGWSQPLARRTVSPSSRPCVGTNVISLRIQGCFQDVAHGGCIDRVCFSDFPVVTNLASTAPPVRHRPTLCSGCRSANTPSVVFFVNSSFPWAPTTARAGSRTKRRWPGTRRRTPICLAEYRWRSPSRSARSSVVRLRCVFPG